MLLRSGITLSMSDGETGAAGNGGNTTQGNVIVRDTERDTGPGDELKKLSQKRATLRRAIKANENRLNTILTEQTPDQTSLETIIEAIKTKLGQIQMYDAEIQDKMTDDDQLDIDIEDAENLNIQIMVKRAMAGIKKEGKRAKIEKKGFQKNAVKLPKIDLPPFNGDPMMYFTFMELFESTVSRRKRN